MQLLNGINDTTDGHWMGAVHASAVSSGKGAVLFTAESGSGKSTFAAMLLNKGYRVLADDYSPISLHQTRVYPFPEGISVKSRSRHVLQPFFPNLISPDVPGQEEPFEVFIPISDSTLPSPEPVIAIVFLQYDPVVELEFKSIPNLKAMDPFIQQLWLPPDGEVAVQFMDWFFQIPCYTLTYSNTQKAICSVAKLFR
jgi:hypothetical protein